MNGAYEWTDSAESTSFSSALLKVFLFKRVSREGLVG